MGRKNIHIDGQNTQFGKGQDATKGGRKPSLFTKLLDIAKIDEEPLSKEDILKFTEYLFSLSFNQLANLKKRKEMPAWIVTIISAIESDNDKGDTKTVAMVMDRILGKPKQQEGEQPANQSLTLNFVTDDSDPTE